MSRPQEVHGYRLIIHLPAVTSTLQVESSIRSANDSAENPPNYEKHENNYK